METLITIKDPSPEADFTTAIGIDTTREVEVLTIINEEYVAHQADDLQTVVAISARVSNTNELAFAMLQYGICMGRATQEEIMLDRIMTEPEIN